MPEFVGYQVRSTSGVINTSGTAVSVYGYHVISPGAATIKVYDGTSASGTLLWQSTVTSAGASFDTGGTGVNLPNGCYVDIGASTSVTVWYRVAT